MADIKEEKKKRKNVEPDRPSKKLQTGSPSAIMPSSQMLIAGKIHKIHVRNFMCHDSLEIILNPNVNFIVGRNGSGKSALLTALTVGLGARAGVTMRATSLKEFIKKGKNNASIEVTITNEGPLSFKREEYGKTITVVRQIGNTSSYKMKNSQGKVLSTKKEELDRMLYQMNIQVENPISVLNQDVSRTFLVTAQASDKYQLFMKATQMDIIGNNYKEAQLASEEARSRLNDAETYLTESKKEVKSLEKSLEMLESVEASREEVGLYELEMYWANAIAEERNLVHIEKNLNAAKTFLGDIEGVEDMRESKEAELATMIEEHKNKIREIEGKTSTSANAFQEVKERYVKDKEALSNKVRDKMTSQGKIKRVENDIAMICGEIKRLESAQDTESERTRLRQQLVKFKQDLEEVEAMLRTKQNEQMHLSTDKVRLEQEDHAAKMEVHHCENRVRKSKQQLAMLKQQTDSSLTVFGAEVPRLLKRIDEEYKKGRFQKKPIGPLGAFIKIKDPSWTPAVESYLGSSTLGIFAVDNAQDAKILNSIIQEIYRNQRTPTIVASKFFSQVHDVSRACTGDENYMNLFDVMEISDPIVANCLIDQREPECVLLIPTSKEASEMLSDRRRVPQNCKRGLTKTGDEFFPDPNYRSYGGKVGRPKFLQVSTSEAILAETEELGVAEEELSATTKRQRVIRDKLQRTIAELTEVSHGVMKLRAIQNSTKSKIDGLADELDIEEPDGTAIFIAEKAQLEQSLAEEKEKYSQLTTEIKEMQGALKLLEEEVKRCREVMHSVDSDISKIRDEIRKLDDEREMLKLHSKAVVRKLQDARQAVQKSTAEYEIQKRVTDQLVAAAETHCPRMQTKKTAHEIKRLMGELKAKIIAVEQKVGLREDIEAELAKKRDKYKSVIEFANSIGECNDRHLARLQQRRAMYKEMKKRIGQKVQVAFTGILELRQYKGSIKISHSSKTLELEVTPQNTARRATSDARTLSGGERSYSTVAFILALWDCTGLPFYFLDEFDVFMDKVNRRIIMEILLDHTRSHPQSQFAFLTPLDTSITLVDDYITIHQLAAPERTGDTQQ